MSTSHPSTADQSQTPLKLTPLIPLFISAGLLLAGNGLLGTLTALRAREEGFGDVFIGLLGTLYFTGFVVACLVTPRLIQRAGHIRVFAALAAGAAASALAMVLAVEPIWWLIARFVAGFCFCGTATVLESWLNAVATNSDRGRILGTYRVVDLGAVTGGQLFIPVFGVSGFEIFAFVALLLAIALIPVALSTQASPAPPPSARVRPGVVWSISPVAAFGCLTLGLTNAAFRTVGPVYAQDVGLSVDQVALFISFAVAGGALMNFPLGMLSDRFDRRSVLIVATLGAAGASLFLSGANTPVNVLIGAFFFGAFALPLYSLSMAHGNDHADRSQVVELTAGLILFYGIGAIIGPFVSSALIGAFGSGAFFVYTCALHGTLILFVIYRMTRRAAVPRELRKRYVGLLRTSPMMVRIAMGRKGWKEE